MDALSAATLLPMMAEERLKELAADIRDNGQAFPIIVWDSRNLIVDGRNRMAACESVGVEPKIERREFADEKEAAKFAFSANIPRRHLKEAQRAMIAARLKRELFAPAARARIADAAKRGGGIGGRGRNSPPVNSTAGYRRGDRSRNSREEAAAALEVSSSTVTLAEHVIEKGVPELCAEVDAGNVSVAAAAELSEHPPETQVAVLQSVKSGEEKSVRAALAAHEKAKPKRRKVNADFDASVLELHQRGLPPGEIARELGVPAHRVNDSKRFQGLTAKEDPNPFHSAIEQADDNADFWRIYANNLSPAMLSASPAFRNEFVSALKREFSSISKLIDRLTNEAAKVRPS